MTLGSVPVIWNSKLQSEIAMSTMESEYIALSAAMRELVPLRLLLDELLDVYKIKSLKYDYPAVILGTCFLCRTAILKELGGFDEIFAPFYKEDLDIAMRAIKHGYKVKYIPSCGVHHEMGSTINRTQTQWRKYMISKRNKFLLAWKHINTLPRWMSHIFFVTFSLLTRWIILDSKWYAAFFCALSRKLKMGRKGNQYPLSGKEHQNICAPITEQSLRHKP